MADIRVEAPGFEPRVIAGHRIRQGSNRIGVTEQIEKVSVRIDVAQIQSAKRAWEIEATDNVDVASERHALRAGVLVQAGQYQGLDENNTLGTFTFSGLDAYAAGMPITFTHRVGQPRVINDRPVGIGRNSGRRSGQFDVMARAGWTLGFGKAPATAGPAGIPNLRRLRTVAERDPLGAMSALDSRPRQPRCSCGPRWPSSPVMAAGCWCSTWQSCRGRQILLLADSAYLCVGDGVQSGHTSSCPRRAPSNGTSSHDDWDGCRVYRWRRHSPAGGKWPWARDLPRAAQCRRDRLYTANR